MAFDVNAMLRPASAGAISANGSGTGLKMGCDLLSRQYCVSVPGPVTGTTPTLDVVIEESDDNVTWRKFLNFEQITKSGQYYVRGQSNAKYRRASWTVGGTTPNFGVVKIGPVQAGIDTKY